MKRLLKLFGVLSVLGSLAAAAYYFLVMRTTKPQVELYFDDGAMLAFPGSAAEAEPFMQLAADILMASPVAK